MVTPSNNRLYKGKEFNPQQRGYRDTFVKPTTVVEQKRGALDVMTEALVAINPALNAIFSNQIKDAVREEKKKGFELAVRENRKEGGFKGVVDELRKNEEDGITNRFIGGSIFAEDAFNEARAGLLSNRIDREIQTLYATSTGKKQLFTKDGLPILDENQEPLFEDRPLFEFDKNSDAYREFAQKVNAIGDYEVEGLDPKDHMKYLEAKEKAFLKVENDHITKNKDFKFNNLTSMNNSFLLQSWVASKDSDLSTPRWDTFGSEEEALAATEKSYNLINSKITLDFQMGLTSDKTKKYYENLINNVESVALQINTKFGRDEAFAFLDWAEKIKYGNGNNTLLQHKDFAMKKFNLKVKISKEHDRQKENADKDAEDKARREVNAIIEKALETSPDGKIYFMTDKGKEIFDTLYKISPEYKDLIDEYVDLYNGDRKQTLLEFRLSINSGDYDDEPERAGTDFLAIVTKLGGYGRLTKLERELVKSITGDIRAIPDNQLIGGYKYYNNQIKTKVFNILKLTETDTGAIVSMTDYYNNVRSTNPFELDGKQANIIGQKVIREAGNKLNEWRRSLDKPPTEAEISKFYEDEIIPFIDKSLVQAINPENITFDLFARDGSTYTVTLNRFNNADLYNKFQKGDFTPINPPKELFTQFKIPDKFYQQYFNDRNLEEKAKNLSTFRVDNNEQKQLNEKLNQTDNNNDGGVITDNSKLNNTKVKSSNSSLEELIKNKDKKTDEDINNKTSFLFEKPIEIASTELNGLLNENTFDVQPLNYRVQENDNLSVIAERYDVSVEDILEINPDIKDARLIYKDQLIKIPKNLVHQVMDFKSQEVTKFTDHGGLARVIRDGESSNNYDVVNYGNTGLSETVEGLSTATLGEILEDLKSGKYYAVGAYQFKAATFEETMKAAGLGTNTKFSIDAQDRMFWARIMNSIRPNVKNYILGKSDDIDAALEDIAMEFAAAPMANGKGFYDNDERGNKAIIDLDTLRDTLKLARKSISGK